MSAETELIQETSREVAQWEINPDGYYPYCSRCGKEPPGREMTPYCPMCGAPMARRLRKFVNEPHRSTLP